MMENDDKLSREKAEIATRLRRVCSHLSEESFAELVNKIALSALKSRGFGSIPIKRQAPTY